MCYLIGYSAPEDKVWSNVEWWLPGKNAKHTCATTVIHHELHMKSHGIELKATVTSHLTTWAMAVPIFICLNLSSGSVDEE